jgi:hypothetical protein
LVLPKVMVIFFFCGWNCHAIRCFQRNCKKKFAEHIDSRENVRVSLIGNWKRTNQIDLPHLERLSWCRVRNDTRFCMGFGHCLCAFERTHRTLNERITPYISQGKQWDDTLPAITFANNCSVNSSIKYSPCEVLTKCYTDFDRHFPCRFLHTRSIVIHCMKTIMNI